MRVHRSFGRLIDLDAVIVITDLDRDRGMGSQPICRIFFQHRDGPIDVWYHTLKDLFEPTMTMAARQEWIQREYDGLVAKWAEDHTITETSS